jgi:hypothetical protein
MILPEYGGSEELLTNPHYLIERHLNMWPAVLSTRDSDPPVLITEDMYLNERFEVPIEVMHKI